MKKIKIFTIPDGVFGYLNVLPNIPTWVLDYRYVDDWQPAQILRRRSSLMIAVPQYFDWSDKGLGMKDWINQAMMLDGYYAILSRPNTCFGVVYAEQYFISPQQEFVANNLIYKRT